MQAFHNDPDVKAKYVARLKAHHAAEEIIQGIGFDGSHGCAVGCTLNYYSHAAYKTELGLPEWLAMLEDTIFEGLDPKKAQQFAVDFLDAIPVGADVSNVRYQLAILRAERTLATLKENAEPYARECEAAIRKVISYLHNPSDESAWSARSAAESAARSAESAAWSAWSAAESAARSAAKSAWSARSAAKSAWSARSAAESAESAAWSARSARSAAAESAESAVRTHYEFEADNLIRLLKECQSPTARDK